MTRPDIAAASVGRTGWKWGALTVVPQWLVSAWSAVPRGTPTSDGSLTRRVRSCFAAAALVLMAAAAVQLTGAPAAYYAFFIAVPLIALYGDWLPLAAATVIVVFSPGLLELALPAAPGLTPADPGILAAAFLLTGILSLIPAVIVARNRSTEQEHIGLLESQALHDPLTGLANRSLLATRLDEAMKSSRTTGASMLVLSVDIDGFKPINDSFGHAAGDALLVEIARRLQFCLRTGDTAARTGGDEFTLLVPCAAPDQGPTMAERIMDAVAAPIRVAGTELRMSASVGITRGTGFDDAEQLLAEADTAMYAAKHSGRSRFVIYDPSQRQDTRGSLEVDPQHALAWAAYMGQLRSQIAAAKEQGLLPEQTRGPETVRRTLESLLAAIGQLQSGQPTARLALPQSRALAELVFHHQLVQQWADSLVVRGVLTVQRPAEADLFWAALHDAVAAEDGAVA